MTPLHFLLAALVLAVPTALLFLKPSRIELKLCSNWTLWPMFVRTRSANGTKRFWLIHCPLLPFTDLWFHWEVKS